jgi:hypothetical protein
MTQGKISYTETEGVSTQIPDELLTKQLVINYAGTRQDEAQMR